MNDDVHIKGLASSASLEYGQVDAKTAEEERREAQSSRKREAARAALSRRCPGGQVDTVRVDTPVVLTAGAQPVDSARGQLPRDTVGVWDSACSAAPHFPWGSDRSATFRSLEHYHATQINKC